MKSSFWAVNLGFLPVSNGFALLFLRLCLGMGMFVFHGWDKLLHFGSVAPGFPDPLSIGSHTSLILVIFAECFCSMLLIGGILSRFAAAVLVINMSVALFMVHGADFSKSGAELSALYLVGYGVILLAGPGRWSADAAGSPFAVAGLGTAAGIVAGYPLSYAFQSSSYTAEVPFNNYLTGIRSVLENPATRTVALIVWITLIVVLAVVGYMTGRIMNRTASRKSTVLPAPAATDLPPADMPT